MREVINTGRRLMDKILSKIFHAGFRDGRKFAYSGIVNNDVHIPPLFKKLRAYSSQGILYYLHRHDKKIAPVSLAVCIPKSSFLSQKATWYCELQKAFTMFLPMPSAPPVMNAFLGSLIVLSVRSFG